jgi:hypothetical protein
MADNSLETYLNDHLGGAMLGADLAEQIRERSQGSPLGELMDRLAPEIEEDRQTLIALMEALGASRNPVKQASAWVAEKASRLKFRGVTPGEPADFGLFMALETLTLGVGGKLALWKALREVAAEHPPLAAADLETLIARAQRQQDALEAERILAARRVLGGAPASA